MAREDIDLISAQDDVSVITVVGAGMRGTPGVAGRIFTATGDHAVNVIAIAQGSSECGISLVVEGAQHQLALSAIHSLTLGNRDTEARHPGANPGERMAEAKT
jgi:aspartate kinase